MKPSQVALIGWGHRPQLTQYSTPQWRPNANKLMQLEQCIQGSRVVCLGHIERRALGPPTQTTATFTL